MTSKLEIAKLLMAFKIKDKLIGEEYPTYFIAEIGSNFDQNLERAKELIKLAKDSGANAAKFQHYTAQSLVNELGFSQLGKLSHQAKWNKSVFETYEEASLELKWTSILKEECDKVGIHFMTSAYSYSLLKACAEYIPCIKIGSGDISNTPLLEKLDEFNLPILIGTGASTIEDVSRVYKLLINNLPICIMQCNTNYQADIKDFQYQNIHTIKEYKKLFPKAYFGLSCHSKSPLPVYASVALGARVIEKHFTDDCSRPGPDHSFALTPNEFSEMVENVRNLDTILGSPIKSVQENEKDTYYAHRRSICTSKNLSKGHKIEYCDLDFLRPFLEDAYHPYQNSEIIGKILSKDVPKHTILKRTHFD